MKKIAFFVCLAVSSPLDAAHSPWQQLAKADLDFIYQNLKDNHPGVIDQQNPEFNQWLENGYRQAVDSIEAVIDLDGLINIQRKYIAGFADGHVDLSFKHQRTLLQWPGFIIRKQGVDTVVTKMAEQFGQEADVTHAFRDLASRMTEHSGNELVPQSISVATTDIKAETSPSLTSARVVLLTDADCASACLDFADILLPLGAIHAGQPTFADTVYMDIRTVELPSKLGRLSIPQKVYRNRPRGHNQAYFPADKWYYQGNINNTAALRDWLLQQLATE